MLLRQILTFVLLSATSIAVLAQKDINGASNTDAEGISLDTNVSFTLSMTLASDDTPWIVPVLDRMSASRQSSSGLKLMTLACLPTLFL